MKGPLPAAALVLSAALECECAAGQDPADLVGRMLIDLESGEALPHENGEVVFLLRTHPQSLEHP